MRLKLKNVKNLEELRRKIANSFTDKGAEVAEALRALIDEVENSEVEVSEKEFAEKVRECIKDLEDVPEVVADAITKASESLLKRINDSIPADKKLDKKITNAIAGAVLKARGKEEARAAVNAILTKNEITGLTFEAVTDYVINWKIEDLNPLFGKLHKTMFNRFFYGEAEMTKAKAIAKGWKKANAATAEKTIEQLEAKGKTLSTDYIYKRQRMAFSDLDEIEQAGQLSYFLGMISKELDQMIVNTIVMAILVGDNVNTAADKVTTFETIGTKTETDLFTTVVANNDATLTAYLAQVGATTAASKALATARFVADTVKNPYGKEKVAIMNSKMLSDMAGHKYADGGDITFRTKEEIAAQIGVDAIYLTDVITAAAGTPSLIVMIPDGYWYKEVKTIDVAYPEYSKNAQNYLKERNAGGAIHDLQSTAVLKVPAEPSK